MVSQNLKNIRNKYMKVGYRKTILEVAVNLQSVKEFTNEYNIEFILDDIKPKITKETTTTFFGHLLTYENCNYSVIINRKANKTMYQILDTLAHELIHIKHSNHNKTHKFETKKLREKLFNEFAFKLN